MESGGSRNSAVQEISKAMSIPVGQLLHTLSCIIRHEGSLKVPVRPLYPIVAKDEDAADPRQQRRCAIIVFPEG